MPSVRPLAAFLGGLLLAISAFGAAATLIGRPLVELLEAARGDGIVVVFNNQLVPDSLRVVAEPRAQAGLPLLQEILAPHGLQLTRVGAGVYAVNRSEVAAVEVPPTRVAPSVPVPTLEEVIVSTSRYAFGAETPGSHTLLSSEALQTMPRLGDETLRALQRLPGVAGNGVSGMSPVRGGEPDETLILLNGLVLYEPFHLKNFLSPVSLLDSRFIGGLDFYSGGFGAEFGDRMSAVIDAHSLETLPGHRFELGLSLFHTNGMASGSVDDGRGHWLVSARQSVLGQVLKAFETDFGNPEYADGFAHADYALTDATRIAVDMLGSRDEIDLNWDRSNEVAVASYRNSYIWTTVDHDWTDALTSQLIASYTDVNNDRKGQVNDPDSRSGNVFDKRHFRVAGVNLAFNWNGFHGLHEWGAEAKELTADYQYSSHVHFEPSLLFPGLAPETDRNLTARPDGWKYAAYWTSRFALGDRWVTDLGLRAEDQGYTGPEHSVQLNPRASLLYTVSPQTRIRASWGQFSQSQRINELQLEDGVDWFAPAQHAKHAVLSLDHSLSTAVLLRIEAYRKDYSQLKARYENLFDPLVLLPELQADRVRIAPSSARMDGIEASVSWRPAGPWSGWFNYSWSEAEDTVDGHKVLRSWDQKHAISTGLRWAQGRWDVTVADTWHTGWPTTAVSLQTVGNATTAVIGPRNGDRLKSFNSLDVRASYRFTLPRGELETYVEVTNLGNQGNPCCYDYRTTTLPDGSVVLDQDGNDWLGIVPSVGVLWKY